MSQVLEMFKSFVADKDAWDMFLDGTAGTGKTTECKGIVQHCMDNDIDYLVCAFTHQACGILRSKLPDGARVTTLHSYLNKRPTVDQGATNRSRLHNNTQMKLPTKPKLLIVDERSMVGERDFADVRADQDEDYDGLPEMQVLWVGDPFQLPPVGDTQAVKPYGEYKIELTENKRRGEDNPLGGPIEAILSYLRGTATPAALKPNENFIRDKDLVEEYKADTNDSKVMLCWTNEQVQNLNIAVAGKTEPTEGDKMFCPTSHRWVTFIRELDPNVVDYVNLAHGETLSLGTKYRTLEYIIKTDLYRFFEVSDEEGDILVYAVAFGHYTYKVLRDSLGAAAVASNKAIEDKFKGFRAAYWAKSNEHDPLARQRSKAWRDFLSFNECVVCLDFPYAMTVYKSQGSTYDHVYVDTNDIGRLVATNWDLYLKMTYVALSRAAVKVITN